MNDKEKIDLRVLRTRKLLASALFDLMEKHAFATISVKQLCDEAMVHRTTFYKHFNDKNELLAYATRLWAEEYEPKEGTPVEIHDHIFGIAKKHGGLFAQLFQEEPNSLRSIMKEEISINVQEFINEHLNIPKNSLQAQIATEAYVGAVFGVLNWWIQNDMQIEKEEIYKEMRELILMGYLGFSNS